MRRLVVVLFALLPLCAFAQPAQERIVALETALLEAMKSEDGFAARQAQLRPVVLQLFDIPSIARISTGRAWRNFDEAQREELVAALERLLVATYADRFDSFNGQAFAHVGVAESRTGPIVKTEIVRANGERVPVDYYFRGDRVFNVVASGVSDLSLRRADYSSILKEQGYAALVEHINDNIRELEDAQTAP